MVPSDGKGRQGRACGGRRHSGALAQGWSSLRTAGGAVVGSGPGGSAPQRVAATSVWTDPLLAAPAIGGDGLSLWRAGRLVLQVAGVVTGGLGERHAACQLDDSVLLVGEPCREAHDDEEKRDDQYVEH